MFISNLFLIPPNNKNCWDNYALSVNTVSVWKKKSVMYKMKVFSLRAEKELLLYYWSFFVTLGQIMCHSYILVLRGQTKNTDLFNFYLFINHTQHPKYN